MNRVRIDFMDLFSGLPELIKIAERKFTTIKEKYFQGMGSLIL